MTFWILESAEPGREIEEPFEARDRDDDRLMYSLEGADSRHFEIDEDSGQLRTRSWLDFETREKYVFEVVVSDGRGEARIEVTVNIVNSDEPPVLTGPSKITAAENESAVLGVYSAVSPEGRVATLSLAERDAALFTLAEDGSLTFLTPPDFENPQSAGGGNTYHLRVNAMDRVDNKYRDVTIRVTNVDEPGILTIDAEQVVVGEPVRTVLTDPDGSLANVQWQWSVSNDGNEWSPVGDTVGSLIEDSDGEPGFMVSSVYTPSTNDATARLRVTVFYSDGYGAGTILTASTATPILVPSPTPTPIPTPTPTATPTPVPTATPEPTVTPTAVPTATPEPTARPTVIAQEPTAAPRQPATNVAVPESTGDSEGAPLLQWLLVVVIGFGAILAVVVFIRSKR